MDENEMFEQSLKRPANFFKLKPVEQWDIDYRLGLLDWKGDNLTKEQINRFFEHFIEGDKK